MAEMTTAEFAIEAALLQGRLPHNHDDLEIAMPCRCYERGLTKADFVNLRWPAAMRAGVSSYRKARTRNVSPIKESPKLCSRGRGQLMTKSAAEYDMIQSQRSSRSSEHGQIKDRIGSVISDEDGEHTWQGADLPKGYICPACNNPGHHIQNCPVVRAKEKRKKERTRKERSPATFEPTGSGAPSPSEEASDMSFQATGLPKGYICHACNVPGHHIQNCPTRVKNSTVTDRRSDRNPDWRSHSPQNENRRNGSSSREHSQSREIDISKEYPSQNRSKAHSGMDQSWESLNEDQCQNYAFRDKSKESPIRDPKPLSLNSNTDFFRPQWLNPLQMNNLDNDSGFHLSSVHDDPSEFFYRLGGRRTNKEFNLKEEEFPDLGSQPQPSEVKREKPKKKVKMVSYTGNNSPTKLSEESKVIPHPSTYSNAVKSPNDCEILITGLPVNCGEKEIHNLLELYGQVKNIKILRNNSRYSSAVVGLDSPEIVEWVIDCLNGAESLFHGVDVPLTCCKK